MIKFYKAKLYMCMPTEFPNKKKETIGKPGQDLGPEVGVGWGRLSWGNGPKSKSSRQCQNLEMGSMVGCLERQYEAISSASPSYSFQFVSSQGIPNLELLLPCNPQI